MSGHLASGVLITLVLILAAMVGFRRWFLMFSEGLLSGGELLAGIALFGTYLAWLGSLWGTLWGYPALLPFAAAMHLQSRVRGRLEHRRRRHWVEDDLQRCRELVGLDSGNHGAYEEMARLYSRSGQHDRAIAAIHQAIALAPHIPSYRYVLELLLERQSPCKHEQPGGAELRGTEGS